MTLKLIGGPILIQVYNIEPLLAGAIEITKVDLVQGWFSANQLHFKQDKKS